MAPAHPIEICVVGSVNEDIVVGVSHHPEAGETILGGDWFSNPGGKGANQAVAAARMGRRVGFVGAVGTDDAGATQRKALIADGIDTGELIETDAPTGRAFITVASDGENRIVVSPGANARVTADQVDGSTSVTQAELVLLQLEIPLPAVAAAVAAARGRVVLNPAPAPSGDLDRQWSEILAGVAVVVPNEGELAQLVGAARATSTDELVDQAKALQDLGVESVVVTLGADGVLVVEDRGSGTLPSSIPAVPATVVDTTAAGDTFCGAFGDALVGGASLLDAAGWGNRAAAVAVARRGAQASIPLRHEVPAT